MYKQHLCLIFELLSHSLYELLKDRLDTVLSLLTAGSFQARHRIQISMVCRWIWLENSRNNFANPLPSFISYQVSRSVPYCQSIS